LPPGGCASSHSRVSRVARRLTLPPFQQWANEYRRNPARYNVLVWQNADAEMTY